MKIAIDLGNRNTKLAYRTGDKVEKDIFQARFTDEEQQDYTSAEVIELDGIKYCIEQGNYDFEFNKTEKNYLPLLLAAISRATSESEIEIMMGAPAEHVLGLRDIFKEQLLDKEFNFKYKDEERNIKINKLGVIGEGFATYFPIPETIRNSNTNLGIIDIGGRTINIVTFINGKQHIVCTLNFGILDLKNNLLKELKKAGKDYDLNVVENLLLNDRIKIDEKEKEQLIKRLINELKIYKIDIDLYNWIISGGGVEDLGSEILEKYFGEESLMKDSLFTNVLGAYNFMSAKLGV